MKKTYYEVKFDAHNGQYVILLRKVIVEGIAEPINFFTGVYFTDTEKEHLDTKTNLERMKIIYEKVKTSPFGEDETHWKIACEIMLGELMQSI